MKVTTSHFIVLKHYDTYHKKPLISRSRMLLHRNDQQHCCTLTCSEMFIDMSMYVIFRIFPFSHKISKRSEKRNTTCFQKHIHTEENVQKTDEERHSCRSDSIAIKILHCIPCRFLSFSLTRYNFFVCDLCIVSPVFRLTWLAYCSFMFDYGCTN